MSINPRVRIVLEFNVPALFKENRLSIVKTMVNNKAPSGRKQKKKRLTPQPSISETRKLGQWPATAICGNDITSSALYVAAIATY